MSVVVPIAVFAGIIACVVLIVRVIEEVAGRHEAVRDHDWRVVTNGAWYRVQYRSMRRLFGISWWGGWSESSLCSYMKREDAEAALMRERDEHALRARGWWPVSIHPPIPLPPPTEPPPPGLQVRERCRLDVTQLRGRI